MKIPITRPFMGDEEGEAVCQTLRSGWLVQGPRVRAFEEAFARFVGASHAVATTSCTTALHLALHALGIGPGDEVILPSFTFIATANAVCYVGAKPVLADIDLDTFNLDPAEVARLATSRTKALLPVHLFGLMADMEVLGGMARAEGWKVVEDAACGMGAAQNGRHCGRWSEAGCFSFHPRKAITTGEGGMVVVEGDEGLAACLRRLRDHGAGVSDRKRHEEGGSLLPDFDELGFNYRMTDLQGAVGVEQMKRAPAIIEGRRARAARYDELLPQIEWLVPPAVPAGFTHGYQSYVCRIRKEHFGGDLARANLFRNRLMRMLEEAGVSVRQGTHAVHTLGQYQKLLGCRPEDMPRSLEADRLSLTLPLYADMTDEEQGYVLEQLRTCAASLA